MVRNKLLLGFMLIAVLSLAGAGCSGDDPVDPGIIDEAPIIPPTMLTVEMDKGKANLDWWPSVDTRVVNYFVDREHDGDRISLGRTTDSVTHFTDDNPLVGSSTYYVYAAGTGAPQSSTVSVSLTISRAHRTDELHE